jgi:hypothetical protein
MRGCLLERKANPRGRLLERGEIIKEKRSYMGGGLLEGRASTRGCPLVSILL